MKNPARHTWKLLGTDGFVRRHRCQVCRTVRVRMTHGDRFPSTRYELPTVPVAKVVEESPSCAQVALDAALSARPVTA